MASELAAFIADRRAEVGLNAEQLAFEAGVDKATIDQWEQGAAAPSPAALARLSRALEVPMDELFAIAIS
jgi:transcriptional regulator with XRE-family HTH domain